MTRLSLPPGQGLYSQQVFKALLKHFSCVLRGDKTLPQTQTGEWAAKATRKSPLTENTDQSRLRVNRLQCVHSSDKSLHLSLFFCCKETGPPFSSPACCNEHATVPVSKPLSHPVTEVSQLLKPTALFLAPLMSSSAEKRKKKHLRGRGPPQIRLHLSNLCRFALKVRSSLKNSSKVGERATKKALFLSPHTTFILTRLGE